jgi:hypothetical protein
VRSYAKGRPVEYYPGQGDGLLSFESLYCAALDGVRKDGAAPQWSREQAREWDVSRAAAASYSRLVRKTFSDHSLSKRLSLYKREKSGEYILDYN